MKNRFDFNSLRVRLWLYFITFAGVILLLIWYLQIYFINSYYEEMKVAETSKIANQIVTEYQSSSKGFSRAIEKILNSNDVYIQIENSDGSILFKPSNAEAVPINLYSVQVQMLKSKLMNSPLEKVAINIENNDNSKILAYACYLDKSTEENIMLYLFSPLYPVQSTVSILRNQLKYITLIALALAVAVSLYLASRISKPIQDITTNAAKMGEGNYNITFKGGQFTEISELADTLNKASTELEKTSLYQKDLIANVSHDLKTPLTMIKSYAELIRDISGNNPEKRDTHLQVIIDETDRLNTLVSDMLNLSRMQSKKITLVRENFDIKEICESLISSYDILTIQEGYHIKFNCQKSIIVNADLAKTKQVLANLLNNAVKYCGLDKEIIINVKKVRNYKVRCEIIDHGAGIAPDELSHVFERYYKSSTHHVRDAEGTGLGLSIVKEILTLHNFKYGAISKLGKGSTFWFEMDMAKTKQSII